MKFGVSLTGMGQQPRGTDMRQSFGEIVEYVRSARDLGFDFIYQGQHYLTSPYQQLQTMPLLARLAAETGDMSIVATLLVPLHHPVDLAERIATMDVITNGRFILAAALGYRDDEYDAFAVNPKRRVSRYMECLELMRKLWTEEKVTYTGQHFQVKDAEMVLKPMQKPHPPVWVAANSDAAIQRAATNGYSWYVNPHATHQTIKRQIQLYNYTAGNAGLESPKLLPMGRELFVHDDKEKAFQEVEPFLGGKYEAYAQWGQDKAMPKGDDNLNLDFDDLARDRFLFGSPDEVTEQIVKFNKNLGANHFILGIHWVSMPNNLVLDMMNIMAEEVFPQVEQAL